MIRRAFKMFFRENQGFVVGYISAESTRTNDLFFVGEKSNDQSVVFKYESIDYKKAFSNEFIDMKIIFKKSGELEKQGYS